jgi:heme/copper-type cytochrome/quinol oxidase subunit 4
MAIDVTLDIISTVSGFFPVLVALYNYKYLDNVLKVAAAFFLVESVIDPAMWFLPDWGIKNNMPLIHINIIVTVLFFTVIYYKLFSKPALKKITIILSVITLIITFYYNLNMYEYPSVSRTASGILLIFLSLIYFYQLLNPLKFIDIEKQGLFWINAGVLFYSAVNIFLFMIFTQIPVEDQHKYYIIHSITNIITNILYSVGLFCKPQKTT